MVDLLRQQLRIAQTPLAAAFWNRLVREQTQLPAVWRKTDDYNGKAVSLKPQAGLNQTSCSQIVLYNHTTPAVKRRQRGYSSDIGETR